MHQSLNLLNIAKSYNEGVFGKKPVLEGIHLTLMQGEFLYLVGGSGAGKSSLLRILALMDRPTHGRIELFGNDISKLSSSDLAELKKQIGYVPQNSDLIPELTVFDNVALGLRWSGKKFAKAKVEEVLYSLGLIDKRNKSTSELSGGEQQRVTVARAIVKDPSFIVADEPTGAQDKEFSWIILELLVKAHLKGSTVVVATHDREMVRRVRKKCAVLQNGKIRIEEGLCSY